MGTTPESSDLAPMANEALAFMDTAGARGVGRTQFQAFLTVRNVDAGLAEMAFHRLGRGKETLTAEEFLAGLRAFFTSPDPLPVQRPPN